MLKAVILVDIILGMIQANAYKMLGNYQKMAGSAVISLCSSF